MISKISNVKFLENALEFTFCGTAREGNSIRRFFLNDIPVLAVDKVEIYQNTTVMNDEFIINRLRMIPVLSTDIEKELVELELNERGTKTIYSDNITGPVKLFPGIIITKLKDHILEAKLHVTKGTGSQHVRWTAVSVVIMKQVKEDEVYTFYIETLGQYTPKQLYEMIK